MNMMENIRRIGIFMIAAQTVMHFAAGKQYEKYMKIITGIIVLLLFVTPFVSFSDSPITDWQTELERMEQQIQSNMKTEMNYIVSPAQTVVLRQIEEEIKERMNDMISERAGIVTDVEIVLKETYEGIDGGAEETGRSFTFDSVKVILRDKATDDSGNIRQSGMIHIDEITVGHEPQPREDAVSREAQGVSRDEEIDEYRQLFAQILGITADKVEVIYHGGW
ncbi:MAG: stage III sporulation protein AF [Lachnospiraceae bacterium]|nr:stage III sporulation protein AF [Lachnospiraceae bacterium]